MSKLLRLLLPLIAYLCVGTMVSAAIGYGYLRHTGRLSDQTMFRIVALVHGVDLEEIDKAAEAEHQPEIPPEEASYLEQQNQFQAASLQFDAKRKQLNDALTDFEYKLRELDQKNERYTQVRDSVEAYIKLQSDLAKDVELQKVRAQIEVMNAKKQAKPILLRMIAAGRTDEVIMLLGMLKKKTQEEIILSFDSEEDLDMLYRIQEKMLQGGAIKPFVDSQLKQLQELKQQDR